MLALPPSRLRPSRWPASVLFPAVITAFALCEALVLPIEDGAGRPLVVALSLAIGGVFFAQHRLPVLVPAIAYGLYVARLGLDLGPVDSYVSQGIVLGGFLGAVAYGGPGAWRRVALLAALIAAGRAVLVLEVHQAPLLGTTDVGIWVYAAALGGCGVFVARQVRDRHGEVVALRRQVGELQRRLPAHAVAAATAEHRRVSTEVRRLVTVLAERVQLLLAEARAAMGRDPARAEALLARTGDGARETVAELRRLVDRLRDAGGAALDAPPELAQHHHGPRLGRLARQPVALLIGLGLVDVVLQDPPVDPLAQLALAVVLPLPLLALGRRPLLGLLGFEALLIAGSELGAFGGNTSQGWIAALAAAYLVGTTTLRGARAAAAAAIAALAPQLAMALEWVGWSVQSYVSFVVMLLAVWCLGRMVRSRLAAAARAEAELAELHAARHAIELRAAQVERNRLARELHDAVGQSVLVVGVQAAAAQQLLRGGNRGAAEAAVRAAGAGVRAATAELERLERALPDDDAVGPGLADLPALAAVIEATGVDLELAMPEGLEVPEAVSVAAYRIVQEALANICRHASGASALVRVRAAGGRLELDVVNGPGTAAAPDSGGHGLRNMTERARELGGELWVDRVGGGGFAVHARLPLSPAAGREPAYAAAL